MAGRLAECDYDPVCSLWWDRLSFAAENKSTKDCSGSLFLILGIISVVLFSAQRKHNRAENNKTMSEERTNRAGLQAKLDEALRENGVLGAKLDAIQSIASTSAQKQDLVSLVRTILEGGRSDKQLYGLAMTLQGKLRFCGSDYDTRLKYLGEDEHSDWVAAMEAGDKKKAERVTTDYAAKRYAAKRKLIVAEHRKNLKTLLSEGRVLRPQLVARFPGPPPQLRPNAESLLRTGEPDNNQAIQTLAQYLRDLAGHLEKD